MHPALRKGPFLQKVPTPHFPLFYKKHPHFISCLRACYLCLCPSVRSRSSVDRDERIDVVFGTAVSFDQSHAIINSFRYLQN